MSFDIADIKRTGVVFLFPPARNRVAKQNEAALKKAWRVVLDDPNYNDRRILEKRWRASEDKVQKKAGEE